MNARISIALVAILLVCNHISLAAGPQFMGLLQDFYAAPEDRLSRHSNIATMDLDGAVGELVPLAGEHWTDVVQLPSENYLAIDGNDLGGAYYIDHNTMIPLRLPLFGPQVPLTAVLVGMTYDDTRDRLVVATIGERNPLLEFKEGVGVWRVIGSAQHPDMQALAYRQKNDTLYGLGQGGSGTNRLFKFDGNGELLGVLNLSEPIGLNSTPDSDWQMMLASDGRLAAIGTEWVDDEAGDHIGVESRVYLIDADTGLVSQSGSVPEPRMAGMLIAATALLTRVRARVVAERAGDRACRARWAHNRLRG